MHTPLWTPSPARVAGCAMTQFRARAAALAGRDLPDQAALYDWSLADPSAFWRLLWDEAGVIGEPGDIARFANHPGFVPQQTPECARLGQAPRVQRRLIRQIPPGQGRCAHPKLGHRAAGNPLRAGRPQRSVHAEISLITARRCRTA